MRVLLVPPKSNYPDKTPDTNMPGLGFPHLAAMLKSFGHEVFGVNISYQHCPEGAQIYLEQTLKSALSEYKPELIGLGGLSADYLFVRDAIEIVRKCAPNIPVVCGGGLFSGDIHYMFKIIRPDFAVIGEGEETLISLINAINQGLSPAIVKGIAYWHDGEMILTEKAESTMDLDSLELPDYDIYDLNNYFSILNQRDHHLNCRTKTNPRLLPIMASRSCPFACTFCFHTMGTKYRSRTVENVIDEIVRLYHLYQINIIYLYDELFSVNRERVHSFCELLKKTKLDIHWTGMMRVSDIDYDMLKMMKDAGCTHVSCGFESASPIILKSMGKKINAEQIRKTIEMAEKVGIGVQAGFIYGDPAEVPETIKTTLDFFDSHCRDHIIHSFYITPFPGSKIFSYCLEKGIIRDRKSYYESIHLRPVYNMTSMPYETFHKLLDPIVRHRFIGFKKAIQTEFKRLGRRDLFGREVFQIDTECPHCMNLIAYHYPIDFNEESVTSLLNALTPIELFCSLCHKRFCISTLGLTGFEKEYTEYINRVKELENSFRPVVITPVIGEIALQNHKFYGFNWGKLNIVAFMEPGGPDGTTFCGYPSIELTQNNVLRNIHYDFIVAPHDNYQKYVSFLIYCGVSAENLHYLEIKSNGKQKEQNSDIRNDGEPEQQNHGTKNWLTGLKRALFHVRKPVKAFECSDS